MTHTLVLIRHGESMWNNLNRFTGWSDVELSGTGVKEAKEVGRILKKNNLIFDQAYTSVLTRAIRTYQIAMEEANMAWLPVHKHWRLNERHYGALQGRNKSDTADDFGSEDVHIWRRSYNVRPPLLSEYDQRHPFNDERYRDIDPEELPTGESLHDTLERVIPYWEEEIRPQLMNGKKIIISAHGNTVRALAKKLENISNSEVAELEIPTGKPIIYKLDPEDLHVVERYYLKDPDQEEHRSWFSFLFGK